MIKNIDISDYSTIVIGDVHGKIDKYWKILQKHKNGKSIQDGDFGFKKQHEWHLKNIDNTLHKVNFGNHDDYTFLNKPHSLQNWSYGDNLQLMTIRGAYSIDRHYRIKDIDWWENEQLTYAEMQKAIDFYTLHKPKIMISHDAPHEVRQVLFNINDKELTSNGLQAMFELYQPDLWIFAHHHKSRDIIINGTRFVGLNELDVFTI